ncbi:WD40 repeat-like protein [Piromyces finnis]|uniref:WD40 repeat-like protein n=1 Tax=Piromyces finnis TaxID=1754191 RepID=A0A1Y1VMN1_9FUNG|nr:WD40 repeat-like protein [Piromyces finnis]|eukprot:ORX60183.1 WD40 repeat-like protein [Piromyces finnis]
MEIEKENDINNDTNNFINSKKKRSSDEAEIINNIEDKNQENEQIMFEIKRSRTKNDGFSVDSDFEKDNSSKSETINKSDSKKENNEEEEDFDETELEKDHHYCLNRLYLKRIIRENHASPIRQIVFNHKSLPGSEFDASNIVATVAKAGITIYDNEHCGNHFDIMNHFILNGQGYLPGPNGKPPIVEGQMNTMCWVRKIDDAIMATAGVDKVIHILSLSYLKEIVNLIGHEDAIEDLKSHPKNNNIILSSSSDGTIRIWDIYKEKCICIYKLKYNPTVIDVDDKGKTIIVGTEAGYVIECNIPEWISDENIYNKEINTNDIPFIFYTDSKYQRILNSEKKVHSTLIDSIGYIGNNNILSKDINGHIYEWDLETEEIIKEFKHRSLMRQNRCRFGISYDKSLFVVGTAFGTALIFDLNEGKIITEIGHKRSTDPVKCSIFTQNCKSIIYTSDNATIWRFDYVSKKQKKEWENWRHAHPEIANK